MIEKENYREEFRVVTFASILITYYKVQPCKLVPLVNVLPIYSDTSNIKDDIVPENFKIGKIFK